MNILILTLGSRGDIQPYIALGSALVGAGHVVKIMTSRDFESIILEHSIGFESIDLDMSGLLTSIEGRSIIQSGANIYQCALRIKEIMNRFQPVIESIIDRISIICGDFDRIIVAGLFFGFGDLIHQICQAPVILSSHGPRTPTTAFQHPWFPNHPHWLPIGKGIYHRSTFRLADALLLGIFASMIRQHIRTRFGHQVKIKRNNNQYPSLYCYSPSVIPRPAEWDHNNHISGYWFLDDDSDWQPPTDLELFLQTGPKPVYIGFGSMSHGGTDQLPGMIRQALKVAGQRGIILRGRENHDEIDRSRDQIYIDDIPHYWLFPRVSLAVHHGGAGTTAAALRAGIPSVIIPHFGDQAFWGQRIYDLGCGPRPLNMKQLTPEILADVIISSLNDPMIAQNTNVICSKIQAEKGLQSAVEFLGSL